MSASYNELLGVLRDSHRHEVAAMWEGIATAPDLSPQDRAQAERMSPVVHEYLAGRIDREEYEKRIAVASIPAV